MEIEKQKFIKGRKIRNVSNTKKLERENETEIRISKKQEKYQTKIFVRLDKGGGPLLRKWSLDSPNT